MMGRVTQRETNREKVCPASGPPQLLIAARLEQAGAELEPHPFLPHGWQGPSTGAVKDPLLLRCFRRKLELQAV